jgi:hypothetical protein
MVQSARSPSIHDEPIDLLAMQLAETVAAAMEQAGLDLTLLNRMALTSALNKALERLGTERERTIRQARIAQRTAWVDGQGLLTAAALARHLGLSAQELQTAQDLALITPVEVPRELRATSAHFTAESWHYYRPNRLTDEECAQIAHATLLTRMQAAERLGVPLVTFDQWRAEQGLLPASQTCAPGRTPPQRYHTDEVDRLRATAARQDRDGRGGAS